MAKYNYVCSTCGSENVLRDAWVAWNVERQKWELVSTFQAAFCEDCEGGASLDAIEIDHTKSTVGVGSWAWGGPSLKIESDDRL
jgi:DNA-directed RNA polymerase subunit RPC12/RpoP